MSTILNALKKSEELRNTKIPTQSLASNHYQYPVAEETQAPVWPYVAIAVLSTSLVCGGLFWYLSPSTPVSTTAVEDFTVVQGANAPSTATLKSKPASIDEMVTSTAVVEQSAPILETVQVLQEQETVVAQKAQSDIEFLPAKEFKTVPLPVHVTSQKSQAPVAKVKPQTNNQVADDPLADLDLSNTSPELAAKIRLALGNEPEAQEQPVESSDSMDYSDVPDNLAEKFKRALAADTPLPVEQPKPPASAIPIGNLPKDIQAKIPTFAYNSHVYSSLVEKRSVRFNGTEFKEGDSVFTPDLTLLEIRPDDVIMRYDNQSFSIVSMQDWKGY
ncbi:MULTISPECIES: general secretion pathway protein GspB [unclassified Motilimonas]|uniref:general secretion pathway protein GspB n=1 Tax=Motilimonas TaxID=1914248 RepID=UPI001E46CE7C|nr:MULTISPECIES: general secretion pathway protein GspB [unclassified Motilimonas]MCE0557421.1 general secretion pathway protein GspB [Motilimonas sp. E26]MDO6526875.1 general secretion pathway protein GspB [Motilimonas sp. 1_MG-2023]